MKKIFSKPETLLILAYLGTVIGLTQSIHRTFDTGGFLVAFITLPASLILLIPNVPFLDLTDRYLPSLNFTVTTIIFTLVNAALLYRVRNFVLIQKDAALSLTLSLRRCVLLCIRILGVAIILIGMSIVLWFYGAEHRPPNTKIGERTFYKDPDMELKIGLHYSDVGISYQGNTTVVSCKSKNTREAPGALLQGDVSIDAGWTEAPETQFADPRSKSIFYLEFIATEAKKRYLVQDNMTLAVIQRDGIAVSFDGCGSFSQWNASKDLTDEYFIKTVPEFEACTTEEYKESDVYPNGKFVNDTWVPATDEPYYYTYEQCAGYRWGSEGTPTISNVIAKRHGFASFDFTSPTLEDNVVLHIKTIDFGKTWTHVVTKTK